MGNNGTKRACSRQKMGKYLNTLPNWFFGPTPRIITSEMGPCFRTEVDDFNDGCIRESSLENSSFGDMNRLYQKIGEYQRRSDCRRLSDYQRIDYVNRSELQKIEEQNSVGDYQGGEYQKLDYYQKLDNYPKLDNYQKAGDHQRRTYSSRRSEILHPLKPIEFQRRRRSDSYKIEAVQEELRLLREQITQLMKSQKGATLDEVTSTVRTPVQGKNIPAPPPLPDNLISSPTLSEKCEFNQSGILKDITNAKLRPVTSTPIRPLPKPPDIKNDLYNILKRRYAAMHSPSRAKLDDEFVDSEDENVDPNIQMNSRHP